MAVNKTGPIQQREAKKAAMIPPIETMDAVFFKSFSFSLSSILVTGSILKVSSLGLLIII
jgi:hypothetical protein